MSESNMRIHNTSIDRTQAANGDERNCDAMNFLINRLLSVCSESLINHKKQTARSEVKLIDFPSSRVTVDWSTRSFVVASKKIMRHSRANRAALCTQISIKKKKKKKRTCSADTLFMAAPTSQHCPSSLRSNSKTVNNLFY